MIHSLIIQHTGAFSPPHTSLNYLISLDDNVKQKNCKNIIIIY